MANQFTYHNSIVHVGDTVRVGFNVKDGDKTRQQMFEGIIIAIDNRETGKNFTIRKVAAGEIGVERIVPLGSPIIGSITVMTKGDVRRAKLFYLRNRIGKSAMKIKKMATTE